MEIGDLVFVERLRIGDLVSICSTLRFVRKIDEVRRYGGTSSLSPYLPPYLNLWGLNVVHAMYMRSVPQYKDTCMIRSGTPPCRCTRYVTTYPTYRSR